MPRLILSNIDLVLDRIPINSFDAVHILVEDCFTSLIAQLQRLKDFLKYINLCFGKVTVGSGNAGGIMESLYAEVACTQLLDHDVIKESKSVVWFNEKTVVNTQAQVVHELKLRIVEARDRFQYAARVAHRRQFLIENLPVGGDDNEAENDGRQRLMQRSKL